ncbi:hypothetical protein AERO9A_190202 [Aeromonas salmonicida]|nr:hypothetical protein AERO9A_190202 [Aeromonas salmonicida]
MCQGVDARGKSGDPDGEIEGTDRVVCYILLQLTELTVISLPCELAAGLVKSPHCHWGVATRP